MVAVIPASVINEAVCRQAYSLVDVGTVLMKEDLVFGGHQHSASHLVRVDER